MDIQFPKGTKPEVIKKVLAQIKAEEAPEVAEDNKADLDRNKALENVAAKLSGIAYSIGTMDAPSDEIAKLRKSIDDLKSQVAMSANQIISVLMAPKELIMKNGKPIGVRLKSEEE